MQAMISSIPSVAPRGTHAPATRARTSTPYRHDLDGLRGLAILLVVLGHVWLGRVSGGVDAFLVLSGVFVVGATLRRVAAHEFRLGPFALKVARRLLPVVVPVVLVVVVGAVLIYPPTRWSDVSEQAIASVTMTQNWWLAFEGTAYGGADVGASPFQHLWSLSVQAQLYLGVAVLLLCLGWTVRSLSHAVRRRVLITALVVLAVASFTYASIGIAQDPVWTYFDTFARTWELLAGALVGLVMMRLPLAPSVRTVLGWAGLGMLLATMWVVDGAVTFPGPWALLPVGGTLLVIVAGVRPTRVGVDALLRTRPAQFTGRLAFGLYAWHWPLLVGYLEVTERESVPVVAGVVIIALSFALAELSRRLVETPFRAVTGPRRGARLVLATLVLLSLAVPAGWIARTASLTGPSQNADLASSDAAGQLAPVDDEAATLDLDAVLSAAQDAPRIYADHCIARGTDVVVCQYGPDDATRALALVGGSHSGQWFTPLEEIANAEGFRLITYLRDECYFGEPGLDLYLSDECDAWNVAVADRLVADQVDAVFTTATRSNLIDGVRSEWVPQGYLASWQRLADAGIPVVAVRDTPWLAKNPLDCLADGGEAHSCGTARQDVLQAVSPTAQASLGALTRTIDLNDFVCPENFCPAVLNGYPVYRDDNHLTSSFAATLREPLAAALASATGWW